MRNELNNKAFFLFKIITLFDLEWHVMGSYFHLNVLNVVFLKNNRKSSEPSSSEQPGSDQRDRYLSIEYKCLNFARKMNLKTKVGPAANRSRAPPSEQSEPEPRKYMGGNIPSRSFRMLQAMTALDPNGEQWRFLSHFYKIDEQCPDGIGHSITPRL